MITRFDELYTPERKSPLIVPIGDWSEIAGLANATRTGDAAAVRI